MGYLAFGKSIESVIIYNMPYKDGLSIIARVFYLVCIAGSYVLLIQPVFYIVEHTDDKPVISSSSQASTPKPNNLQGMSGSSNDGRD